jgi:hypothetical protein
MEVGITEWEADRRGGLGNGDSRMSNGQALECAGWFALVCRGRYRFTPGTGPGADPTTGVAGADVTGRIIVAGGRRSAKRCRSSLSPPCRRAGRPAGGASSGRLRSARVVRLRLECRRREQTWTLLAKLSGDLGTGPKFVLLSSVRWFWNS